MYAFVNTAAIVVTPGLSMPPECESHSLAALACISQKLMTAPDNRQGCGNAKLTHIVRIELDGNLSSISRTRRSALSDSLPTDTEMRAFLRIPDVEHD